MSEINVKELLERVLKDFYNNKENKKLIDNVMEMACSGQIFCLLSKEISEIYKGKYNVDVEYNRNGDDSKKNSCNKLFIPDIIVHKRGNNDDNFIVIEFKTWKNINKQSKDKDIRKLKCCKEEYGYKNAFFIVLKKEKADIEII